MDRVDRRARASEGKRCADACTAIGGIAKLCARNAMRARFPQRGGILRAMHTPIPHRSARAFAARAVALYAGSALSAATIKLSARQLLEMPLPRDARQWMRSARELKRASLARTPAARERALRAFASASCQAHGLRGRELAEVLAFWESRMGF